MSCDHPTWDVENDVCATCGAKVGLQGPPMPISEEQYELFSAICHGEETQPCLVSTCLDGEPTAAIAFITENEDGSVYITPVAVLITPSMFGRMTDPAEGMLQ